MGTATPYEVGKRDITKDNHWQKLEIDEYKIDKPTLICFGGNATISAKSANLVCSLATGLIGMKEKTKEEQIATSQDVDVIGFSYGEDEDNFGVMGSLTEKEIDEISNKMFMPLCYDKEGNMLSKEDMLKNFNKITFFNYCYGICEANKIMTKTYENMKKLNLDKKEINEVLQQVTSVSYAPLEVYKYSGLQVLSMRDYTVFQGPEGANITREYLLGIESGEYPHVTGATAYSESEGNVTLLTSSFTSGRKDHFIRHIARDEDWKLVLKEAKRKEDISSNSNFKEFDLETFDEKRNDKFNFYHSNNSGPLYSTYGDDVSKAMGIVLGEYVGNSIYNYYNEMNSEGNQEETSFVPKPSEEKILEDVKEALGSSYNPEFEGVINEVKLKVQEEQVESNVENVNENLQSL